MGTIVHIGDVQQHTLFTHETKNKKQITAKCKSSESRYVHANKAGIRLHAYYKR